MTEMIPTAIAKYLIEGQMRDDASLAQHIVMHEALALLIGELHRVGAVDADRLAARLIEALAAPEIEELAPGTGEQAATLAGRIRGAAHLPVAPDGGTPAGK